MSPRAVKLSGEYLANSNIAKPRSDAGLAQKLSLESERIVQKVLVS